MNLIEETKVPAASLPVSELRTRLRMGSGFSDDGLQDGLLESYLRAALATIEGRIGKTLLTRRYRFVLDRWRGGMSQALPTAPVTAIVSMKVGGLAVSTDRYWLVEDMHRPRIVGRNGLPVLGEGAAAEIVFEAGFGDWTAVPADLQHAVLLLASEYYEVRHEAGLRPSALPVQVAVLIERWRTVRLLGGAPCG
ncbi:hypothetical protein [Falsirhodobacter sp. alg1]|uniref:head-tail connector protein n=1 Tax=Falsirhodobacter sp. alg1 TaxID=1472418 RepID=UPI0005EDD5C3|nr:hypothetical protein [Falsirhodobacter sp. alg1]